MIGNYCFFLICTVSINILNAMSPVIEILFSNDATSFTGRKINVYNNFIEFNHISGSNSENLFPM